MPIAQLNNNTRIYSGAARPATTAQSNSTSVRTESSAGPQDSFRASEAKPDFMQLRGAKSMFVSNQAATRVQRAVSDPKVKSALSSFNPQLQQQISGLSDAQLNVLKGGISGTSEIGPVSVDNRKAFIKGTVMMKSIWGNVHQSISDARSKYSMINGPEENGLHKLINNVSQLKPEERRKLAELMDSVR